MRKLLKRNHWITGLSFVLCWQLSVGSAAAADLKITILQGDGTINNVKNPKATGPHCQS